MRVWDGMGWLDDIDTGAGANGISGYIVRRVWKANGESLGPLMGMMERERRVGYGTVRMLW